MKYCKSGWFYKLNKLLRGLEENWQFESKNNLLLKNNVSNSGDNGIILMNSNYCSLLKNKVFNNENYGIYLLKSNYSFISENRLVGNKDCIKEEYCEGNQFKNNYPCYYREKDNGNIILLYGLIILLCVICFFIVVLVRKYS